MELSPEVKDFMQQQILISSNYGFVVEGEQQLSTYVHSITHHRDITGQYLTVSFCETVENYDYLHGMLGRELVVSVATKNFDESIAVVRVDKQHVKWAADYIELDSAADCICSLVARLEFV